jgi:pimeloyl-ACP methyl ester carboxylesterase
MSVAIHDSPPGPRRLWPVLAALVIAAGRAGLAAPADPPSPPPSAGIRLETGEIEGAKFVVARPAQWNGCVLLIAHDYRAKQAPLVADLNPDHLAHRTLLDEGWVIAKTSYRRNGAIIRDAIADLENLRAHIAATGGEPRRVLLEGDSMGGTIVTLIAEQFAGHYQGVVAVDAVLQAREKKDLIAFNLQPQIPLVFLTNQSELNGPQKYVTAPFDRLSRPLLLKVARDGHVNVNQRERLVALRTVVDLIEQQPVALLPVNGAAAVFDATQEPVPGPSQVQPLNEGGFEARVIEVTAVEGNLLLNAQPSDFSAADIAPATWFEIVAKGQSYQVLYGRDSTSVKPGLWVAFPNADGFFCLARNQENAATTAGLDSGSPVIIHRIPENGGSTVP